MRLRLWVIGAAGLVAVLAVPAAAQASEGAGIQAGPVRLSGAAHPGGSYALPAVTVVNTGTQQESLAVRIERVSAGHGLPVPAAWIQAAESSVSLAPNESARIPLHLRVPAGAKPGRYFSNVVVSGGPATSAGGTSFAVGAATDLEFTVAAGAAPGPWFTMPGWVLLAMIGILLAAAAAALAHRSGVRIRIEREPAGGALAAARRSLRRGLAVLAGPAMVLAVASCGTTTTPPQGASKPGKITLSLTTVSAVRAVSVSPSSGTLTSCQLRSKPDTPPSRATKLGFPNGRCFFGTMGPPASGAITILNKGVGAHVAAAVSDASPRHGGDGDQWSPCNSGSHPAVSCTGPHDLPGTDQFEVLNFNNYTQVNRSGLSASIRCDHRFTPSGSCWAHHDSAQYEGVEFIGPLSTTDYATAWQLTITWYAVP